MDEELFQKIVFIMLVLMGVAIFMIYQNISVVANNVENIEINNMLDIIYEKCIQGKHTKITDVKGENVSLKYENGVCIIK